MAYYDLEKTVGKRERPLKPFTEEIKGKFYGTNWQKFFDSVKTTLEERDIPVQRIDELTISADTLTIKGVKEE